METNSVKFFKENNYHLPKNIKPPIIIAWHLRTPENYGNLLRIADTIGCAEIIFVLESEQLSERKIRKTARDSYNNIKFRYVNDNNFISEILKKDYTLVAVETAKHSENIYNCILPKQIALIVGNEKKGICNSILEKCHKIVHIPLTGTCTSLNVSHATSIALFEWLRQTVFNT